MCKCVNIKMGSYENQIELICPWPPYKIVGIDNCIAVEIHKLWQAGIQTIESCCGHNTVGGYIAVIDSHVNKMIELGYESYQSNFRNESGWDDNGYRKGMFKPKSI